MVDELVSLLEGRRGHFEMESGYHSEQWYNLDRLFTIPAERLQPFVAELSRRLAPYRPDAICGPKAGGAKLAERIAAILDVECFHTERREAGDKTGLFPVDYVLPENQRVAAAGKNFAIVDDAISAGSAVRGTHATLLAVGGRTVAFGALIVFGDAAKQFTDAQGIALERIAHCPFDFWTPKACPLCRTGSVAERVSDAA